MPHYDNHKAAAVNKMVEVTKRLLEGAKDGDCPYTSQPYKVIKCTNKFFKKPKPVWVIHINPKRQKGPVI